MNIFNAQRLAKAYDLRYVVAEKIIREAREQQQRRLLSLTVMVVLCIVTALLSTVLDIPRGTLARHLLLAGAVILSLIQQLLVRHRARQSILDAAQQAAPQKS
jgi:hypothetical protein